eukprot:CAMPEP_0179261154 /NCGR_PEP_ID=MMETSP0797-20121207/26711_1 /TAXON_ID=47934 /ORGANISM="Dinophysis acuminata, Strain DAEP01" /LENGTH=131 /DNA_ID=CAMNT_0020969261 /DNA_START=95 /DNA_END=487 /DNA_ORIENTATION=-
MLDLIMLSSAMGIQQEMVDAGHQGKPTAIIRDDGKDDGNILGDAAEHLSVAFESFEAAVSGALGSLVPAAANEPAPAPRPAKKVAEAEAPCTGARDDANEMDDEMDDEIVMFCTVALRLRRASHAAFSRCA